MGQKTRKPKPSAKIPTDFVGQSSKGAITKRLGIFVVVFSFALYFQSTTFEYAYDDITVVNGNSLVKKGVKSIGELVSSDYWYGFTGKKEGAIYRPVSLIMFAVEWELFPNNPLPGHLINVLLFSLTCLLIYRLLCQLFQNNLLFPFVCTLLYAAHPIHTEVVNNIKSRDEILSLLFSILALQFCLTYYSIKNISFLIIGALLFFLAMLSKETGITFLVIIPLTLFVFRETNAKRLLYTSLALLIAALIYLGLRQMVSDHKSIVAGVGRTDNFLILAKDYTEILASAIYILLQYVKLLVFPHPLSCDYSYAQIELKSFGDISVLLGLILFAGATIYSIIMIRKKNIYAYSILFFLITIFPVSNIPFLFGSSMAERFLYIPSLGFCLLLTLLIFKFTNTVIKNDRSFSFARFYKNYSILLIITAIVVCLYSIKAFSRSRDWRDNLALFGAAVKTSPNSAKAHYGYGSALFNSALVNEGTPAEVAVKFELSKKEYEKALSIFPGYWNTYMGLGLYYKSKNDFKNSAIYFEQARNYSPTLSANIYKELGYAYLKSGQFAKSVSALDSCILLGMTTANIYNFKGSALLSLKKYNEALSAYLIGEKADSADVDILKNIGKCYVNLKEYDKAISYFKRCVDSQPANIENKQLLGSVYQMVGDTTSANALLR